MSAGNGALLAVLAANASYIAVPAVLRHALRSEPLALFSACRWDRRFQ
ncbi:MAG: sodium-dependent bicarbonate transport family permease [Caldimonas sp.]